MKGLKMKNFYLFTLLILSSLSANSFEYNISIKNKNNIENNYVITKNDFAVETILNKDGAFEKYISLCMIENGAINNTYEEIFNGFIIYSKKIKNDNIIYVELNNIEKIEKENLGECEIDNIKANIIKNEIVLPVIYQEFNIKNEKNSYDIKINRVKN